MTTYHAPTLRQLQDWKDNAHLQDDQSPAIMKLEWPIPSNVSFEDVEKAFKTLVIRHAILRTFFPIVDELIVQQVVDYDPSLFAVLRLDPGDTNLVPLYNHAVAKMKAVTSPPLVRSAVWYRESGPVFILLIQHMLCDAWSMKILESEMERLCTLPGSLPETNDKQLSDHWERNKARIEKTHLNNLSYWLYELADRTWQIDFNKLYLNSLGPEAGALKVRKFRGWEKLRQADLFRRSRGQFYSVCLENALFEKLAGFSARAKLSVYSVLAACWAILGMKLTGNEAILIRGVYHNRSDREVKEIVGNLLCDAYLYLRVDEKITFLEFGAYCYRSFFKSMNKVVCHSERLDELNVLTRCFMLFNFLSKEIKGGARRAKLWGPHTTESNQIWSPLFCDAEEFDNTISFNCGYHAGYLDAELVKTMFDRYFELLGALLEYPGVPIQDIIRAKITDVIHDKN